MRDIWLISDTHFGHNNILNFTDNQGNLIRGVEFSDVNEMNEKMVENWNRVVKPQDIIYHLGDVFMGPKEKFEKLWSRLQGKKRLVAGNHDDIKYLAKGNFFQKIMVWRVFTEFGLLLTHVPIHEASFRNCEINVHGHFHQNPSPSKKHRCVSVEQTNYTPINIEQLRVI